MRKAAKHWLLQKECRSHIPVPVLSQLVPPNPFITPLLPPSLGQLSPSISWKCDGWHEEGERTGLLRARQARSHYSLVFHLAQRWASRPHRTRTWIFWPMMNPQPSRCWTGTRKEATMVHLSQSLATQTNHFAPLLLPHCQIVPNATGGAVMFSVSVCGGHILQRRGLLCVVKRAKL